MNVSHERVRQQIINILRGWGMDEDLVQTTAEAMVETNLLGVDSHGISMLMAYEQRNIEGKLNLKAKPTILHETPAMAVVDGQAGLGHPVSVFAMNLAVDKALKIGIGGVGVRNSHHFGATGVYARIASKRGVIGMVTSATRGITMVPTRGKIPVLGTNPIAFALPGEPDPVVFDMGTSATNHGDVILAGRLNNLLPEGVAVDAEGMPTRDPHAALKGGILPFGGVHAHKGYGLSFTVQAMGLLAGAALPQGQVQDFGFLFVVFDPALLMPAEKFRQELAELIARVKATPRQPGSALKPFLVFDALMETGNGTEAALRLQMSQLLEGVISQRLLPTKDGTADGRDQVPRSRPDSTVALCAASRPVRTRCERDWARDWARNREQDMTALLRSAGGHALRERPPY